MHYDEEPRTFNTTDSTGLATLVVIVVALLAILAFSMWVRPLPELIVVVPAQQPPVIIQPTPVPDPDVEAAAGFTTPPASGSN